jgi:hypothetical protein
MNISTRTRIAGATAILGMLVAFTACGTETVAPGTQPAPEARFYPPGKVPGVTPAAKPGPTSADAAERRAQAAKERQDRASTQRWDRGGHEENRLK